jgi:hypothetical protein
MDFILARLIEILQIFPFPEGLALNQPLVVTILRPPIVAIVLPVSPLIFILLLPPLIE